MLPINAGRPLPPGGIAMTRLIWPAGFNTSIESDAGVINSAESPRNSISVPGRLP